MKEIEYLAGDVGGSSDNLEVSLLMQGIETF